MPNQQRTLNFNDTFLDLEHLKECFPDYQVVVSDDEKHIGRTFQLTFEDIKAKNDDYEEEDDDEEMETEHQLPKVIRVERSIASDTGPYVLEEPKKNSIRFTSTQIEAIRSGMQHGLTLVVGPPGKYTFLFNLWRYLVLNLCHSRNW